MAIVNTHYVYCGNRTPTLAGSWLFNEVLTAFPSGLVENVNFTATGGGAARSCTSIRKFIDSLSYSYNAGGLSRHLNVYNFADNKWTSDYKTITFEEGAMVSDEFVNWLTANATKQN